jgi:hypothetical protein
MRTRDPLLKHLRRVKTDIKLRFIHQLCYCPIRMDLITSGKDEFRVSSLKHVNRRIGKHCRNSFVARRSIPLEMRRRTLDGST